MGFLDSCRFSNRLNPKLWPSFPKGVALFQIIIASTNFSLNDWIIWFQIQNLSASNHTFNFIGWKHIGYKLLVSYKLNRKLRHFLLKFSIFYISYSCWRINNFFKIGPSPKQPKIENLFWFLSTKLHNLNYNLEFLLPYTEN